MYIVELIPLIAITFSVRCLQIIVNPPFVGYSHQSKEQKDDILSIYVDEKENAFRNSL